MYLLNPEATPPWPIVDSSRECDGIQVLFSVYWGSTTTCQKPWLEDDPCLRLDSLPRQSLLAFIVCILSAKFPGALEQAALFRQQTKLLVRGFENNAIYFPFLLAIFHSYVRFPLQSSSQKSESSRQHISNILRNKRPKPPARQLWTCQWNLDVLDALA